MEAAVTVEFVPPGIWLKLSAACPQAPQAALFLDRDGVIVEDPGYLSKPEDVRLIAGITTLISAANAAGVPVVVITNQSGIARGLFDWEDFTAVQQEIENQLSAESVGLSAVVACPFHPDFSDDYAASFEGWRKPGPKMIQLAAERLNIDVRRSALVGDHLTDIAAASAAHLSGGVIVLTGHGKKYAEDAAGLGQPGFKVAIADGPGMAIQPLQEFGLPI